MTGERPSLAVLIVSDGIPGHVSQSRGLVRWLGTRFEPRVQEHTLALRAKPVARLALPALINSHAAGLGAYQLFHAKPPALTEDVDLVISAGGNTAFANVILARHFGCPNAFLGSGRRLPSSCFSAHLTLEPTGAPSNVVLDVVPSPLFAAEMNARGQAFVRRRGLADERLWLMSCGGDGAGKTYRASHWRTLGEWMNALSVQHGVRWLVSTSRRTGRQNEDALRTTLCPRHVAYAVWWSREAERILGDLMGAAERLFVTADSMSMINECIAAAKPLTLVDFGDGEPDERYRNALAKFERLSLCRHSTPGAAVDAAMPPPPPLAGLVAPKVDELVRTMGLPC